MGIVERLLISGHQKWFFNKFNYVVLSFDWFMVGGAGALLHKYIQNQLGKVNIQGFFCWKILNIFLTILREKKATYYSRYISRSKT